jgi:hypothetical protein
MAVHPADSANSPALGFEDDVDGTGKTINNFNTLASTDSNTCADPAGCARPDRPVLYVTDISVNFTSRAGDWQFGDTNENHPNSPDFVSGTWKAAVKTVDYSSSLTSPTITTTPDSDPATNNWVLGPGSDTVPTGLTNQGYGAEVRWTVSNLHDQQGNLLQLSHSYRLEFIVHDGDQNKTGGDCGEACVNAQLLAGPSFGPNLAILGRGQVSGQPRVADLRARRWSLAALLNPVSEQMRRLFLGLVW